MTRDKLSAAGIEASHYSGHSFRIGAATTASELEQNSKIAHLLRLTANIA